MKKKRFLLVIVLPAVLILFVQAVTGNLGPGAEKEKSGSHHSDVLKNKSKVLGYGILERIAGQWSGSVFTDTPMGSFPMWYVDFRPVSSGMIAQYTTIDKGTINFLTFLIVKHDKQLKVAMRTEGVFQEKGCVTYEIIEKADERKGYYRFSDFKSGSERAYTEFTFKGNKLVMETYTNKFNKVSPLELHTRWTATLAGRESAEEAVKKFKFPQPGPVADFSGFFKNMSESIYYDTSLDPFSSKNDPYVGTLTVNVRIDPSLKVKNTDELFLILTTKSLYEGIIYKPANLKYLSKHAYAPAGIKSFTFTHVHPGTYYLYAFNDINNDKKHLKGDYMSSNINHIITVAPEKNTVVKTTIDFIIP